MNYPPQQNQVKRQLSHTPCYVPIVQDFYNVYCAWHLLLNKFPKSQRYSLGQTCNQYFLDVLALLIETASRRDDKYECVIKASAKLDVIKLLIRLAKDCKCISNQQYQEVSSQLYHIGKQLGGWMKSLS